MPLRDTATTKRRILVIKVSLHKTFARNQSHMRMQGDSSLVGTGIRHESHIPTPPRGEWFRLLLTKGRVPTVEEDMMCQALAEETFKEACASHTYVCGAGLYGSGHPFKDVFITQSTLICADRIEPFFYTLGVRERSGLTEMLCCFCASGQADVTDVDLNSLFTTALPVCPTCLADRWSEDTGKARGTQLCATCISCISAEGKARCSKHCPMRS